jgi:hypothetical protein
MGGGGGGGGNKNSRNNMTLANYDYRDTPYFPGSPGLDPVAGDPMGTPGSGYDINMGQPGNIADQSSGAYNLGMGGYGNMLGYGGNLFAQNAPGSDMSPYMNPYTQNVVDTTMADMGRQRQWLENQREDEFLNYGSAYGGSRHGIRDSLDDEAFYRASGQVAAPLHQANFQNAQGQQQFFNTLAAQLAGQGAGGLQNMANLGFGFARNIARDQMTSGALQRQMQQQMIDSLARQWENYTGVPARNNAYASNIPQFYGNTATTTMPTPSMAGPLLGMGGSLLTAPLTGGASLAGGAAGGSTLLGALLGMG